MKNFPVKVTEDTIIDGENLRGKTFWISRACCVAVFVFTKYNNEWYILANQRGEGCPDYQRYWNCPCGYVDYNETIEKAAKRELYEESGILIENPITYGYMLNLRNIGFNDSPNDNKQNITFRFVGELICSFIDPFKMLTSEHSETNEIADQRWIPLKDIGKYDWAFEHDKLIFEMFRKL